MKTWVVGPFQCNCRLIVCPKTGKGLLVDPGDEPGRLVTELAKYRTASGEPIQIEYLLHTHAHLDHIGGTRGVAQELRKSSSVSAPGQVLPKIALHKADHPLYLNLKIQGGLFGMTFDDPLSVDHFLNDEEELRIGELRLSVIHTPGHSPGSVCFKLHEDSALGIFESVFSGDTLFKGSVGRTDLWGADQDQMFRSIRNRLLTLDDDTQVCPGHGPDSTVGIEKRSNPFLR